jgi:hypothetical protein
MTTTTRESADTGMRITADLARQIHALSRNSKENLLILLQEDLDGGPFIGDLPEVRPEDESEVRAAWKSEIAGRIEDMRLGRVEAIDAQGSAARLLQKAIRKYGP